jgi:HAD superfamily hydrolase (TIGR01459 family)
MPHPPDITNASSPITIAGLAEIAAHYDAFILDLWGVLHDGVTVYPAAIAALRELRASAKPVGILSNGPRRADAVARRSAELGITPDLYAVIHSSGEETWQALASRSGCAAGLGRRCLPLVPPKDRGLLAGLDLDLAAGPAGADFVLLSGTDRPEETVTDYEVQLQGIRRRDLPMICANPDLEVVRGGVREICAGAIAARYAELGGEVRYVGKPHPEVYARCLRALGSPAPSRVLAVGDSLRTDIAGAAGAGLDSLFIIGGIHQTELMVDGAFNAALFARLCERAGLRPGYLADAFRW